MSFYCKGLEDIPIIGDIEIENMAKNLEGEVHNAEKRLSEKNKRENSTKIKDTLEFKEKQEYLKALKRFDEFNEKFRIK